MVFYDVEGDIRITQYGEIYIDSDGIKEYTKNLNQVIEKKLKTIIFDTINKYGSIETEDIQVNTSELEYEYVEETETILEYYEIEGDIIINLTFASDKKINQQLKNKINKELLSIEKEYVDLTLHLINFDFELDYDKEDDY